MIAPRKPLPPILDYSDPAEWHQGLPTYEYRMYVERAMRDDHPGAFIMSFAEWLASGKPGI